MTDPIVPANPDPDAAELAALRKEKADREKTDREALDAELAELKAYKAEQETKAAQAVKPPVKKADKLPADPPPAPTTAAVVGVKKKRGKGGASRWWFGGDDTE